MFLCDREAVARIADAVPLEGKTVLEIGAGEGILTKALSEKAGRVIAIEIDKSLKPKLDERLRGCRNVEVNFVDALSFQFRGFKTIFGNLPYHLSSRLLFKILDSGFDEAVLCLQKEFAERLSAAPGSRDYSRLSVMFQANAEAKTLFGIPRYSFAPMPKTDSLVVLIRRKKNPVHLNPDFVNALFQHKNQTVRNALRHSRKALRKSEAELVGFADSLRFKEKKVRCLSLDEIKKAGDAFNSLS